MHDRPIVIEATSKKWKGLMLIGTAVFMLGIGVLYFNQVVGWTIAGLGFLSVAVVQTLAWWYHG